MGGVCWCRPAVQPRSRAARVSASRRASLRPSTRLATSRSSASAAGCLQRPGRARSGIWWRPAATPSTSCRARGWSSASPAARASSTASTSSTPSSSASRRARPSTMDPQQRLLLEVAWEALEHAGHARERRSRGTRTGVFVGIIGNDYASLPRGSTVERSTPTPAPATALSIAANRVSYAPRPARPEHGDRHRVLVVAGRACTSPCQSLRAGECDLALAGGVNLLLAPERHGRLQQLRACWPPDGRCKTFDAARRRLRARRGLRRASCSSGSSTRGATATAILARHPRLRRQPGRPQQRAHRAQRPRPGRRSCARRCAQRARRAARRRLRRGARHRHAARRSDRGRRRSARCSARPRDATAAARSAR